MYMRSSLSLFLSRDIIATHRTAEEHKTRDLLDHFMKAKIDGKFLSDKDLRDVVLNVSENAYTYAYRQTHIHIDVIPREREHN